MSGIRQTNRICAVILLFVLLISYAFGGSVFVFADEIPVTGVSLTPKTVTLNVGESTTFTATVLPADATNPTVSYSVADPAVVSVSQSGSLTALAEGATTVTVTTADGGYTDTCTVTVSASSAVSLTGIAFTEGSYTLSAGQSQQLTVVYTPENATDKTVTYSTDNSAVATVSPSGLVTAVGAGTAKVYATSNDGSHRAECSITVTSAPPALTGIGLNKQTLELNIGESADLVCTAIPQNAVTGPLTWRSADSAIATVSDTGRVTAVAAGTVRISVQTADLAFTANCDVTVTVPTAQSLSLPTTPIELKINASQRITPEVSPATAVISWSTSDSSVATVDQNGLVTATGKTGVVRITAVSGEKRATATVVVYDPANPQVEYLAFGQVSYSVNLGSTTKLTVNCYPAVASATLQFSSNTPGVFTVTDDGMLTGVKVGTGMVTVTCGSVVQTASVTVTGSSDELTLDTYEKTIYTGNTFQLQMTVPEGVVITSCVSSNPEIAIARTNGQITGVSAGMAQITVTASNGAKATCEVTVVDRGAAVTGVSLDKHSLTLSVGENAILTATVYPADAADRSVSFTSSAPEIVRVNANGKLTAIAEGTVQIRVYASGYVDTCEVKVTLGGTSQADPWKGDVDTSWYSEAVTEFTISTQEQLAGLSVLVNNGNSFAGKTVKLGNSIGFGIGSLDFTRIGTKQSPFRGTFDGCGYSVMGIRIEGDACALFGYAENATITHLSMTGCSVNGRDMVAVLVGNAKCVIINDCTASGSVKGRNYVGGLVGYACDTVIFSSAFYGNTEGSFGVGGIVGFCERTTMCNLESRGSVSGAYRTGGVAGCMVISSLENSISNSAVSATQYVGGLIGYASHSNITLCAASAEVTGTEKTGMVIGGIGSYVFADAVWYTGTGTDRYFTSISSTDELQRKLQDARKKRADDRYGEWQNDDGLLYTDRVSFPAFTPITGDTLFAAPAVNTAGSAPVTYTMLLPLLSLNDNIKNLQIVPAGNTATIEFSPIMFTLLFHYGEKNVYSLTSDGGLTVESERASASPALSLKFGNISFGINTSDIARLGNAYETAESDTDLPGYYAFTALDRTETYRANYPEALCAYELSGQAGQNGAWYLDAPAYRLKNGDAVTVVTLKSDGTYTALATTVNDFTTQGGSASGIRIASQVSDFICIVFPGSDLPESFLSAQRAQAGELQGPSSATVVIITVIASVVLAASSGTLIFMVIRRKRSR